MSIDLSSNWQVDDAEGQKVEIRLERGGQAVMRAGILKRGAAAGIVWVGDYCYRIDEIRMCRLAHRAHEDDAAPADAGRGYGF